MHALVGPRRAPRGVGAARRVDLSRGLGRAGVCGAVLCGPVCACVRVRARARAQAREPGPRAPGEQCSGAPLEGLQADQPVLRGPVPFSSPGPR